jgi:hypothetical protein
VNGGGTGGMVITGTGATSSAGGSPTFPFPDAGVDAGDGSTGGTDSGPPPMCAAGTIDCGATGCITNDVHNCGTCGHDCTRLPNVTGTVTCGTDGTCTYDATSCAPGYGICSTTPDDGCVAINTQAQCGACGKACTGTTPVCASTATAGGGMTFACASGCTAGQSLCDGACVDAKTDPQHCGTCTNACPTDPAGKATCTAGTTCGITCNAGTHLCGGACVSNTDPKNCGTKCGTNCAAPTSGGGSATCSGDVCALSCPSGETSCGGACLDVNGTDVNNCGGCGTKCTGGKTCQAGMCGCPAGTHDCTGTCASNTSVNSCGAACAACAPLANATVACTAAACAVGACSANFGDCDLKASTGCETNLLTSATNCKTCGHACTGGTCSNGACVCAAPTTNCSDTCINLNTDASHCGTCTLACAAGSTCQSGLCCPSGTTNCSGTCVSLQNNNNACGTCTTKCAGGQTCQGTTCACPTGTTNCSGTCVSLQNNNSNCGGCGVTCGAGQTCQGTTCACTGGTVNCSGVCADLASDQKNCGACGHTCYTGACDGAGNCLPWTVVDTPNTSTPKDLMTDGTHVVWVDTGLTSIRQATYDGTGVMTLSTDATAFKNLLDPGHRIMTMAGGVVVVASETQGLYKAVVNTPSTASMPLAFSTIPTGTAYQFSVALNAAGTRVGVMSVAPTPATQIYDCVLSSLTCAPVGSAFSFALIGAAGNAANYYFPNAAGQAIEFIKFGGPYTFQTIGSGSVPMSGFIAIDSANAYWFTNTAIERAALTGGAVADVVTTFRANTGNYADLVTDGRNVYYTAFGSPAYVGYAPVGGFSDKSVKVIASLSDASGVAAGGGKVFWIDGSTIYGMAAP